MLCAFAWAPTAACRRTRLLPLRCPSMCAGAQRTPENAGAPGLPSFVPASAASIRDAAGLALLRALSRVRVQTTLRAEALSTVHATGGRGDGAPPAVVLLHGFDSSAVEWRAVFPLLCAHAEVFAPDLLGWGLTEKPIGLGYGPAERREHLRAYCEEVVCRPATLVGASLGGAVALDLALACPSLVDHLVLIDAQAYQDRPRSMALNVLPGVAAAGAEVLRSDWLRRQALRMTYVDPRLQRSEDALRMGALHCCSPGWKEAAVDFIKGEGYCLSEKVKEIRLPTLVIWGESDSILPLENAWRFEKDIDGAKIAIVESSGHSPHIEQPEFTAKSILDFLSVKVGDKPVSQGVQHPIDVRVM